MYCTLADSIVIQGSLPHILSYVL